MSNFQQVWRTGGALLLLALASFGEVGAAEREEASVATAKPSAGEPKSDSRLVDGRPMLLVGQGTRFRDHDRLYEMSLWVDLRDARRAFPALVMRAGGPERAKLLRGDCATGFVIWGHFTKQASIVFKKAMSAAEIRDELKVSLEHLKGAESLLALVEDAEAGEEWLLTTRDEGDIELRFTDLVKRGPKNTRLERALWGVWLGERPVSPELRLDLVAHIDGLAR